MRLCLCDWLGNLRVRVQIPRSKLCGAHICVTPVAQKNQKRASNKGAYFSVAFSDCCSLGCVEFVVCQPHCDALIHFLVVDHRNSFIFVV